MVDHRRPVRPQNSGQGIMQSRFSESKWMERILWFLKCPSQKASSTHPVHPPAPQRAQQVRGHAGLDGGRGGLREVDSSGENPSRATSPLIIDFQQLIVLTCTQFSNYDEDYNEEGNENKFVALNVALRTLSLRVLKQSRTCSRLPRLRLLSSLSWI